MQLGLPLLVEVIINHALCLQQTLYAPYSMIILFVQHGILYMPILSRYLYSILACNSFIYFNVSFMNLLSLKDYMLQNNCHITKKLITLQIYIKTQFLHYLGSKQIKNNKHLQRQVKII